jgi:DNA-binding CsgD family transcriptional regulator
VTQSEALWRADERLGAAARQGRYSIYHQLRISASELLALDSFYLGFRQGTEQIVYPYNWDGEEFDDPNVNTFAPEGLTAWIIRHRRTYVSWTDGGALLHRGRAFGDTSRRSAVAIVAPLRERSGRAQEVTGVLAVLSYTSSALCPADVPAVERLAELAVLYLDREREDQERRAAYGMATPRAPEAHLPTTLQQLRRQAGKLHGLLPEGTSERALAQRLCELCAQAQAESLEAPSEKALSALTSREKEIALLLAAARTNAQIAAALNLSPLTVKTHVAHILRKLDVGGRSAVRELLRPKNTPTE